jgi:hypothetical protein
MRRLISSLALALALGSPLRIDRSAELSRKDPNFDETTLQRHRLFHLAKNEGFKTTKACSFFPVSGIDIRRTSTRMYDPIGAASIIYQRQVSCARASWSIEISINDDKARGMNEPRASTGPQVAKPETRLQT